MGEKKIYNLSFLMKISYLKYYQKLEHITHITPIWPTVGWGGGGRDMGNNTSFNPRSYLTNMAKSSLPGILNLSALSLNFLDP